MSLRLPFENLPLGPANVSFPPILSLDDSEACKATTCHSTNNSSLNLAHVPGTAWKQARSQSLPLRHSSPVNVDINGLPLSYHSFDSHPPLVVDQNETSGSNGDEASPLSDDASDEGDDDMSRALAFAKMRSAYTGMSAAMINFNAAMQKSDDEEADGHLSTLASKVISSISQSPTALVRQISLSSNSSWESDEDDLTEIEREECEMVKAYIERWASSIRLSSTYWQGFAPLHTNVPVSLAQRLTVYQAEQAIRKVSELLEIPAPLEFERSYPRITRSPVHLGFAGIIEQGRLISRVLPTDYSPQLRLAEFRLALNETCEDRKVQTVSVRLQAGAKHSAGTQRLKEAQAVRNGWKSTPSRLRLDITIWLTTEN